MGDKEWKLVVLKTKELIESCYVTVCWGGGPPTHTRCSSSDRRPGIYHLPPPPSGNQGAEVSRQELSKEIEKQDKKNRTHWLV